MASVQPSSRFVDEHVGGRVSELRTVRGLSQDALAACLNLAPGEIEKIEAGERRLRATELLALSRAFEAPVDYFFRNLESSIAAARSEEQLTRPARRSRGAVSRAVGKLTGTARG